MQHASQQRRLGTEQIELFHHDLFVETQLQHFNQICLPELRGLYGVVLDVGGGCGFFASAVSRQTGLPSRVVDADPVSVGKAREFGVEAQLGDALRPSPCGDESVVCFNLILHHLVAATEARTRELQTAALRGWSQAGVLVFVNEYIYESFLARGLSGRLIFEITSSRLLSSIARWFSRMMTSLRANTFGVGVRFREADEWRELFSAAGYRVVSSERGAEEPVSLPRRLLMIRSCRRDSFLLAPLRAKVTPHFER